MVEYFLLFLPIMDSSESDPSVWSQQVANDFSTLGEIISTEDFSSLFKRPAFVVRAKLNQNLDWDKAADCLIALGYEVSRVDDSFKALYLDLLSP